MSAARERRIERLVKQAPPLSPSQRAKLAVLLGSRTGHEADAPKG